jgi:small subunit ribosomal protein S15
MITKEIKQSIVTQHRKSETDTGSPEVQISLINARINDLNLHFSYHKKDHQSKQGLLKLVSQRKRLLFLECSLFMAQLYKPLTPPTYQS